MSIITGYSELLLVDIVAVVALIIFSCEKLHRAIRDKKHARL